MAAEVICRTWARVASTTADAHGRSTEERSRRGSADGCVPRCPAREAARTLTASHTAFASRTSSGHATRGVVSAAPDGEAALPVPPLAAACLSAAAESVCCAISTTCSK